MKRLIKSANSNIKVFEGSIEQLTKQGREILRLMEDYKFKIDQTARIIKNDESLTQKIIQKKKLIDNAAGQIYTTVFDLENIDITKAYEDQQLLNTHDNKNQPNIEIDKTQPQENQQQDIQDNNENNEKNDNVDMIDTLRVENEDSVENEDIENSDLNDMLNELND